MGRIRYSSQRDMLILSTAKIVMHLGAVAASNVHSDKLNADLDALAKAVKVVDDDIALQEKESQRR